MDEIAILDFGGQYAHLICNRIRRLGVHAVIVAPTTPASELKNMKGLILSGGPQSVNAKDALTADPKIFELGVPVLGICYGHQLTNKMLGGKVKPGVTKEYGKTTLHIDHPVGIFKDLQASKVNGQLSIVTWMSHWDEVTEMPVDFEVLGHTEINEFAAVGNLTRNIYGIQFHPEVTHTEQGMKILENFVNLTGAKKTWNAKNYLEQIKQDILSSVIPAEAELGTGGRRSGGILLRDFSAASTFKTVSTPLGMTKRVFMLISGGVDSMVAFTLLNKVLGPENVYGLLVDTGFMRKGEIEEVSKALVTLGFHNLHVVDASKMFYKALEGVTDPEEKRRIIGRTFVEIQAAEIQKLHLNSSGSWKLEAGSWVLGQGTIYPDTIESGGTKHADKIKTHHNRVPEIQAMIDKGLVIEPLKDLYKDEVRELGEMLGLPHHIVWRHPFPGPGLAIRILCTPSVIPTHSASLRASRAGRAEESLSVNAFLKPHGLSGTILPIRSVGVQGDARTYRHPLALSPLGGKSWKDFWDLEKLQQLSTELTNRFGSINRVIFNLSVSFPESYKLKAESSLTPDRIALLQEADFIVMNEINTFDLEERSIWQCPTVLLPLCFQNSKFETLNFKQIPNSKFQIPKNQKPKTQNYEQNDAIVLRPVSSIDAMTASFVLVPKGNLENILIKLVTLKPSAIFYDLTNKPPATIEWE